MIGKSSKLSENQCKRCNRKLKDPHAEYGWFCAQLLGVANALNKASDNTFAQFMGGIRNAQLEKQEKSANPKLNLPKLGEATVKQIMALFMGDKELREESQVERENAWQGKERKSKYSLLDVIEKYDKYEHDHGRYETTDLLANKKSTAETKELQKRLNLNGRTDKFGVPLKVDGIVPRRYAALKERFCQGQNY